MKLSAAQQVTSNYSPRQEAQQRASVRTDGLRATAEPSLLRQLLSCAPTERSTRLEDFLTEVLAFVCRWEPAAIRALAGMYGVAITTPHVETQRWHGRDRFDLVIGELGDGPSLILECKIGAEFDPSQVARYLKNTRTLSCRPHVGSVTVYPESFEPLPEDASHWAEGLTWKDVAATLKALEASQLTQVGRYVLGDLLRILQWKGAIVERVDPTVLRPNPGREGLYHMFNRAASDAVKVVGHHWQACKPSFGYFYLYQGLDRRGVHCLALCFSDQRGEIALLIDKDWRPKKDAPLPAGFASTTGEWFDWPARLVPDAVRHSFTEATTYRAQEELLTRELVKAMHEVDRLD